MLKKLSFFLPIEKYHNLMNPPARQNTPVGNLRIHAEDFLVFLVICSDQVFPDCLKRM